MPASQPVEDMPGYVRHWIDNAWYWRPPAGSQDTWRDAILWLAKRHNAAEDDHPIPPKRTFAIPVQMNPPTRCIPLPVDDHAPDAGTKVDYVERLDALLSSEPYLSDDDLGILQSLASQLTALRETLTTNQPDQSEISYRIISEWPGLRDVLAALTHTDQGKAK